MLLPLSMISPINLNNEPSLTRKEVSDLVAYNMLPQEFHAKCLTPDVLPKHRFS